MAEAHARWEEVGLGTCSDGKSTSRGVYLAERCPAGRRGGKVTPVVTMFEKWLEMELEGALGKQAEPRFSPVLWQTEGPTT